MRSTVTPPELGSGHLCTAALGSGVNAALTSIFLLARCTNVLARSGTFWFRTPLFVSRASSPHFVSVVTSVLYCESLCVTRGNGQGLQGM